jgi:hypothetical protein
MMTGAQAYGRVFICRSCLAQEYGRLRASAVAVSPAGAVPSMIAVMMRGDTKASGARWRMWRSSAQPLLPNSHWFAFSNLIMSLRVTVTHFVVTGGPPPPMCQAA